MLDGVEDVPHGSVIGSTTPPDTVPISSGFASNHMVRRLEAETDFDLDEQLYYRAPNPFSDESDSESTQSYQIKMGNRRGVLSHGYSSEESLEPGMLGVIPEETSLEVQMAESHDLLKQSHDLLQQSHDLLQKSQDSRIEPQEVLTRDDDAEMPWYQDTASQDTWQTTPAYHREEVRSGKVKTTQMRSKKPANNNLHKLVVTEEIKPMLQVSAPQYTVPFQ